MPLARSSPSSKPERIPHKCIPVKGEFGRFFVPSASAAKDGKDEGYYVDVLAEEHTESHGMVVGTCPCRGWSVRKTCSHLMDAKAEHLRLEQEKVTALGFEKLDEPKSD